MKKSIKIIISLVVVISMILSVLGCIILYKRNERLTNALVYTVSAEWYQLNRLSLIVEEHFLSGDTSNAKEFRWYVNQTCNYGYSAGGKYEISFSLHNWLALYYDPVFLYITDIAAEADDPAREKALELLKEMNDELRFISSSVLEISLDSQAALLDEKSDYYKDLFSAVQAAELKYKEKSDSFFRLNKSFPQD